MRVRAKELGRELKEANEKMSGVNYLRGDDKKYKFDGEKWKTFLILNERVSHFALPGYCINTTVDPFKAFPSVEKVFDIKEVMKKKLVDVGEGVETSKPIKVKKNLLTGKGIRTSLSHQGILAVCVDDNIQFTDLNNDRQVEMRIKDWTHVGFYDNVMLLLIQERPLREATVERVFDSPSLETFKMIEGTNNVFPWTDVSLLHERRELYYTTIDDKLFVFNVDTKKNTEIDIGRRVGTIASFTGIDCGVRAVFRDYDDKCIYTLNTDNTVTKVSERQDDGLTTIFPLISDPKNIRDAVFEYAWNFVKCGNMLNTKRLISFCYHHSFIRIFRDVFLVYDMNTKAWAVFRLTTL